MKIITTLLLFFTLSTGIIQAQDCPSPSKEKYIKVLSESFSDQYVECPVTITATFYKQGFMRGYKKPRKQKKMHTFQCLGENKKPSQLAFATEPSGDIFFIDKSKAGETIDLERGDVLELTGTTYIHKYFGLQTTYFIVQSLKKVN